LAISIVSSLPEKVWYHICQSRGKNCNNTRLKEEGGCAIWYDENGIWQQINERLKITIPHLTKDFQLPSSISGASYGQKKAGGEDAVFKGHADELSPLVVELARLEDNIQKQYWQLKSKWGTQSNNNNNNNKMSTN